MTLKSKILAAGLAVIIAGGGIFMANINTAQAQTDNNNSSPTIAQLQQMVETLKQQIQQIIALIAQLKPLETCGNGFCRFGETAASCPADCDQHQQITYCGDSATNKCCTDTDAKLKPKDIYKKGNVTYVNQNGKKITVNDECSGTNLQVNEMWCYEYPAGSGDYVQGRMMYDCPNGCKDGACISFNTVCGNAACETGETAASCPADCAVKICVKEGGIIDWRLPRTPECCAGLTKILDCSESNCSKSSNSICAKCGNGKCGIGENKYNCPKDCSEVVTDNGKAKCIATGGAWIDSDCAGCIPQTRAERNAGSMVCAKICVHDKICQCGNGKYWGSREEGCLTNAACAKEGERIYTNDARKCCGGLGPYSPCTSEQDCIADSWTCLLPAPPTPGSTPVNPVQQQLQSIQQQINNITNSVGTLGNGSSVTVGTGGTTGNTSYVSANPSQTACSTDNDCISDGGTCHKCFNKSWWNSQTSSTKLKWACDGIGDSICQCKNKVCTSVSVCGDGVCNTTYENKDNCAKDCPLGG